MNSQPGGSFGVAVASMGDVTGDGVSDLLVGAFQEFASGRAYAHDGATGQPLYTLRSPEPAYGSAFGVALAATGDVDGDDVVDVGVGAPLDGIGGQAYVFSGATGALLVKIKGHPDDLAFGHALAAAGDADGDGAADLLVGDYKRFVGGHDAGVAHVVSGVTGDILQTLLPPTPEPGLHFGRALAGGRDLTGDGVPDWIVAARHETVGGLRSGRVHVYSGSDGALVRSVESPEPSLYGQFGLSLAVCSDLDGDKIDDFVVGAGRESHAAVEEGGAYVFSGANGALVRTLRSPNPVGGGWFGQSLACVPDADADGVPDVAVGATGESHGAYASGTVYVMSGATGEAVAQQVSSSPAANGRFGVWLAAAGGPAGTPSIVIGAYGEAAPGRGAGAVHVQPIVRGAVDAADAPASPTALGPPVPNPARAHVSVAVALAEAAVVDAWVLDAQGRTVARYAMGVLGAGPHRLSFGTGTLATGSYTLRVQTGERIEARPFTVVR